MMKQKMILFIEDEIEILSTTSSLLRDNGYQVINVMNAEDALTAIEQNIPDLIIADIKLPGMDGFDFLEKTKKNEALKNVPIIFLTAFNDMHAMMFAKKSGVADYITKPFDFEYLISRVKSLVPPK
jgi:DNA-binding response OmpR family regulator